LVREHDVPIGIIATPAHVAQDVADLLVEAGVTSILNFAPAVLTVPDGVSLRKVDLAVELQILSFHQQRRAGRASAVVEPVAAADVWVNAADDPENCAFTLPARIRRGPLLVTFATGGRSPALAQWLRRRYEAEFGPEYDVLIDMLAAARDERRARGETTEGLGWQRALDSGMLELIREGNLAEAKERLQACLSSSSG